jgi:hypothetical protein
MDNSIAKIDLKRIIDIGHPLHIISLGESCYARHIPARFHIYNFKQHKVRMPFDGCFTPYKAVCELLQTDFYDFGINLINKTNYLLDTKYNIKYNHELTSDINSVSRQLILRKTCFLECINSDKFIVFFLVYKYHPTELINIINQKYPTLKYRIFNLDNTIYNEIRPDLVTEYCHYVNIPKPNSEYILWEDHETPIGKIFEKKVLTAFMAFLTNITNISYDIHTIFSNRSRSQDYK